MDVYVGSLLSPTSTGSQSYTDAGIQGDFILFISTRGTGDHMSQNSINGIGCADGSLNEWAFAWYDADAVTTSDCARRFTNDSCVLAQYQTTILYEANITAVLSNGFTLSWTAVDGTSQRTVYYVVISGIDAIVGSNTSPTSTGTQNLSSTFTPTCLFMAMANVEDLDTLRLNIASSLAWGTGTDAADQRLIGWYSYDDSPDSDTTSWQKYGHMAYTCSTVDSPSLDCHIESITSSYVQLHWTTVKANNEWFGYVILGSVEAEAGNMSVTTSGTTQQQSGLGIDPELLFMMSAQSATEEVFQTGYTMTFGFGTASAFAQMSWTGDDGQATMRTTRGSDNDHVIEAIDSQDPPDVQYSWYVDSFGTGSFTIYKDDPPSFAKEVPFLVLEGVTAGWPHDFDGVANADIAKIDGVAIADIAKVMGVE